MYTIAIISGDQRIEISAPTAYGALMLHMAHSNTKFASPSEMRRIWHQLKSVDGLPIPQPEDPQSSGREAANVASNDSPDKRDRNANDEIVEATRLAEQRRMEARVRDWLWDSSYHNISDTFSSMDWSPKQYGHGAGESE